MLRLNGWRNVHNFAAAEQPDPADPVEGAFGGFQETRVMRRNKVLWRKTAQKRPNRPCIFNDLNAPTAKPIVFSSAKQVAGLKVAKAGKAANRTPFCLCVVANPRQIGISTSRASACALARLRYAMLQG